MRLGSTLTKVIDFDVVFVKITLHLYKKNDYFKKELIKK